MRLIIRPGVAFTAAAALLLSGCQTARTQGPMTAEEIHTLAQSQCAKGNAVNKEDCLYLVRMQSDIQNNFPEAARYKGRQCDLTIEYGKNQRYSVLSTTGDEALCLKAWGVVSSAEGLPPPPAHFPPKSVLAFRPG